MVYRQVNINTRWIRIKAGTYSGYDSSLEIGIGEEVEGLRVLAE
jgi:hypothetical protein